jgi:diaminopropionate ammonia-lyase
MAGLNCGLPSLSAWEIIKAGADAVMRVEDSYAEVALEVGDSIPPISKKS